MVLGVLGIMLDTSIFFILSISFIFFGLVLLFITFFWKSVETKVVTPLNVRPTVKKNLSNPERNNYHDYNKQSEAVVDISEIVSIIDDKPGNNKNNKNKEENVVQVGETLPVEQEQIILKSPAVLFIDSTNAINYSQKKLEIDKKSVDFAKLKRAGKGMCILEKDGLVFVHDKRLFRLDFHSTRDLKCGDNYCAVKLKGNNSVRLFMIDNNIEFISKINAIYADYQKHFS